MSKLIPSYQIDDATLPEELPVVQDLEKEDNDTTTDYREVIINNNNGELMKNVVAPRKDVVVDSSVDVDMELDEPAPEIAEISDPSSNAASTAINYSNDTYSHYRPPPSSKTPDLRHYLPPMNVYDYDMYSMGDGSVGGGAQLHGGYGPIHRPYHIPKYHPRPSHYQPSYRSKYNNFQSPDMIPRQSHRHYDSRMYYSQDRPHKRTRSYDEGGFRGGVGGGGPSPHQPNLNSTIPIERFEKKANKPENKILEDEDNDVNMEQ
jgi:hypothetical protein